MNDTVSLYIHIPFCVKKCAYCAFYSLPCNDGEFFDAYTEALLRRIESIPELNIKTFYFGGGTPTVLGAKRLCKIIDKVAKTQKVDKNAEITLEVNPKTVFSDDFPALRNAGFNRISIGLQSADDDMLKMLGRVHTFSDFLHCYNDAARCFSNITTDIIFALPYDKEKGYSDKTLYGSLKALTDLNIPHISAYSLTLEEGTALYKNKQSYSFPDENQEEGEYNMICQTLSEKGYRHYEVSSFAKPGYEAVHNTAYWKRESYIGIGPAAHSFYLNRRFSTLPDVRLFIENSSKPFLADTDFALSYEITPQEAEEEKIMLCLRTSDGVYLEGEKLEKAKQLSSMGYGTVSNGVFSLNDRGFRVSNYIISMLI